MSYALWKKIAVMLFRLRKAMSYHPMLPHSTISAPSRRTIPCWCVLKLLISKLRTKLHIKNEIAGVRRFSFHHSGFTSFMAYPTYRLLSLAVRLARSTALHVPMLPPVSCCDIQNLSQNRSEFE